MTTLASPYVVAGCPFVPPRRQRPLRDRAVAHRRDAGAQPAACRCCCNRQPGDLRADRHAADYRRDANSGERISEANIDFPFHFDTRGRTAQTDDDDHIRDLIDQVLFTAPGERVNRPTFGSGLMQLVFAPNSDELAATTQFLVQGALQQWLGDLIVVEAVRSRPRTPRCAWRFSMWSGARRRVRPPSSPGRERRYDLFLLR